MNKNYYDSNAQAFFDDTVNVNMQQLHSKFLATIPIGGIILDAGCGSGRDTKLFTDLGYKVIAFDASPLLATLASSYVGKEVSVRTFEDITELNMYDGIWACASLLHVPLEKMVSTISRLWASLKKGGVFYCSFKLGFGEREHNGRIFTDTNESQLCTWISQLSNVKETTLWRTIDARVEKKHIWVNALIYHS